jgi:hypothetical protein
MNWILDPKIFNYLIMSLYVINSISWACRGGQAQFWYWICAFGITASVTFGTHN